MPNGNYSTYFASQGGNSYASDLANFINNPGNMTYQNRMLWGCVGQHFSGGWYDSGASTYINQVQQILTNRSWP